MRNLVYAGLFGAAILSGCQCDDELGQLRANIDVMPPMLDFGSVPIGSTKELEFTVRNKGLYLLTLTEFEVNAPFVAPVGTATVGTGRMIAKKVGFRPTELGPASGTLSISSDLEGSEPVTIALTGTGIQAAVRVEPLAIDWGEVIWTPSTMPEARTITVSNPGTDNFQLTSIELVGDTGGQITLDPKTAVTTYAPGHSETFEVTYMPNVRAAVTSAVRIKTTAPQGEQIDVSLAARAIGPVIQLCGNADGEAEQCITDPMNRPRVRLFSERMGMARGQIRATNVGDSELTINAVLVNGPAMEFAFNPAPSMNPIMVTPNGDSTWGITYTPQDYQFDSIIVSFSSNSSSGTIESMRVEGDVIRPDLEAVPRGMTFSHQGNVQRGQTTVRLYNCGTSTLRLGTITASQMTGPAPAISLENVPANGTSIAPQPMCMNSPMEGAKFDVVFATNTDGSYSGAVTVPSDDPVEPSVTITVQGTKSH